MNNGDACIVYPVGKPELKMRGTVVIVSASQRSIAVGFDERPEFHLASAMPLLIHPHFGIILFALRDRPAGPWSELANNEAFEIEEVK